uniref:PCGF5 n=1 Tax=Globodera pallida TaxID=36090 RepID=A0A183CLJ6_GLOPA
MDQHQEQHTKNGEHKWLQWHMEHLDFNSIRPGPSHALISSDMIIQQCVECGQMVNNLCTHLDIKTKRCKFCLSNELSQRVLQPQDVRLLKQLMEMDKSDLSPDEERAQRIAEEKHELRVKIGLMHDDFPKLDFKTISE